MRSNCANNNHVKTASKLQTFHDELVAAINGTTCSQLSEEESEQMLKFENVVIPNVQLTTIDVRMLTTFD